MELEHLKADWLELFVLDLVNKEGHRLWHNGCRTQRLQGLKHMSKLENVLRRAKTSSKESAWQKWAWHGRRQWAALSGFQWHRTRPLQRSSWTQRGAGAGEGHATILVKPLTNYSDKLFGSIAQYSLWVSYAHVLVKCHGQCHSPI